MNWGAFLIAIPINFLIIWCICKDISDYDQEIKRKQRKLENLRSSDNIYINVSEEEKEMLDALTRFKGFKSNSKFIHSIIKEESSNIAL